MSTNQTIRLTAVVALAALLLLALPLTVGAANSTGRDASSIPAADGHCPAVLENAQATLDRIDIADSRADYAALDLIADCMAVAGTSNVIPSTGGAASVEEPSTSMDEHQTRMLDTWGAVEGRSMGMDEQQTRMLDTWGAVEGRFMDLDEHQTQLFNQQMAPAVVAPDFAEFKEWQSSCLPSGRPSSGQERAPC